MKPLVSIIIPVYNSSQFISECIKSVLVQTYSNIEIIIIDDGSTDDSAEICKKFAYADNRIKFLQQTNRGQADARNRGINLSKGEWVSFVDSDDAIHPRMIEVLMDNAARWHTTISEGEYQEFCHNLPETRISDQYRFECIDVNERHIIAERFNCWIIWGKVIRRDIVISFPFTPGKVFEDNAVILHWLQKAKCVAYTDAVFYYYRMNPGGTTKSAFNVKQLDFLWALEERIRFCKKENYPNLLEITMTSYLDSSYRMSVKVRNNLNNPVLACSIKQRAKTIGIRYLKFIPHKMRILKRLFKLGLL